MRPTGVLWTLPTERSTDALAHHVQELRREGKNIILVTVARPAESLRGLLGDGPDMYFIDATGHMPAGIAFGPDVFYVDSPMKLEKIQLVMQRLVQRLDAPHILLYHLNVLRDYNGDAATGEFVHRLANQTMRDGIPLDLMLVGTKDGEALEKRLLPFAAERRMVEVP